MQPRYFRQFLSGTMAAVLLAACGSLVDLSDFTSETRLFTVRPDVPSIEGSAVEAGVLIDEPLAAGAISTPRIALMPSPTEYSYLAGAQWEDRPARMLQRVLVDSLSDSSLLRVVTSEGSLSSVEYHMTGELRNFEVVLGPSDRRTVRISLRARLSATDGSRVSDTSEFVAEIAVRGGGTDAIINAFNEGAARIVNDTGTWALTTISEKVRAASQP